MAYKKFAFQQNAVNKLYDLYLGRNKNIILHAPTGAGKTAILVQLMDKIIKFQFNENIAFIWFTPGAGNLEEQQLKKTSQNALIVKPQFLKDALAEGFQPNTVTFINWELVTSKKNTVMKDGESRAKNLPFAVNSAIRAGIKFILIIDEEHRNNTLKAREVVEKFDAGTVFRASATPIEDRNAKLVEVSEESVISEHLITREVVINEDIENSNDAINYQYFIEQANKKRLEIKREYLKIGKNINPLVLIQFPDDKKGKNGKEANNEKNRMVSYVLDLLKNDLDQSDSNIAIWLSEEKINVADIVKNDSDVNYLFMKQAISTGWDAPRAKILVKLRINSNPTFTIQTIGRIRRMPEQIHYDNPILDNAFVYSNDSKYVQEILNENMGIIIGNYALKDNIDKNQFKLVSQKLKSFLGRDVATVRRELLNYFVKKYDLDKNNVEKNELILKNYSFIIGDVVYQSIPTGTIQNIDSILELQTVSKGTKITETRAYGLQLESVLRNLGKYLHIGSDTKVIRHLMISLFRGDEFDQSVCSILRLTVKEWYAFMINNGKLLRDIIKEWDAGFEGIFDQLKVDEDLFETKKFLLSTQESYGYDEARKKILLNKNIYEGYSERNFVKQSKPERMIERELSDFKEVKYYYRSKDHGSEYFSIIYGNGREFYPDYIAEDTNGKIYIIETKGGSNGNIDEYAEAKFAALKDYVENSHLVTNCKFAFVRPNQQTGTLYFNNTVWDDNVEKSRAWKPLHLLFH